MNPSVSVVVPAYNAAPFLGPALDSALCQTYRDFEVLVVDDGSTDDTCSVASSFQGRIRLLTQPRAGAGAARNLAMKQAQAPVIAFLDSDDLWHRNHLETLLGLLRDDAVAIGATSGVDILTSDGRPSGQSWVFGNDGEEFGLAVLKGCPFLPSASAVRRDVLLEAGGFDESLSTTEDWELWLRLLPLGRFTRAGHATVGYRRHPSATSMDEDARARNRRRIAAKHANSPSGHILGAYIEMHNARDALAAGRQRDADECLDRAGRLYSDITADIRTWAFFERFRPHHQPERFTRFRFWQAVRAYGHVCASHALPFRGRQRRRAIHDGLVAAASFARIANLGPECRLFSELARLVPAAWKVET